MIPLLLVSNNSKEIKKYLKKLSEKNSNFYEIKPENKEYSIKEIKKIIKESNIFHVEKRIYYFNNFQNSSLETQNALLKHLEEPPKNTLLIFSVDSENKLIPTIISRMRIIFLNKQDSINLEINDKKVIEKLLKGNNLLLNADNSINIDKILLFFKQRLKHDKKAINILKECLKLKLLQESNNLNQQLVIDHLLILISKTYKIKL